MSADATHLDGIESPRNCKDPIIDPRLAIVEKLISVSIIDLLKGSRPSAMAMPGDGVATRPADALRR